jgi:hypothetical protein
MMPRKKFEAGAMGAFSDIAFSALSRESQIKFAAILHRE